MLANLVARAWIVHDLFVLGLPLLFHPLPPAQQECQALLLLHRGLLTSAVDLWS